ncbi:MAG TPA: hypothetical protein VLU91_03110 [Nitrososphaerales archaeon]|nr:hypothetical protein [Nitrososphaerales archaeon]
MSPGVSGKVSLVRQAHMPGNCETYDPETDNLGPVVCKLCWERFGRKNSTSLCTVWVSYKGGRMVWWLCGDCTESVRTGGYQATMFLKSMDGVIPSPHLDV